MKKNILFLLGFIFLLSCQNLNRDTINLANLESEMDRLKINTALIVGSQGIDGYPLWSADSNFVAADIEGAWHKLRLTDISLVESDWRNQKIGVLANPDSMTLLSAKEKEDFDKVSKVFARELETKTGVKIELRLRGFSTSLIITKKGKISKILWTSGVGNCHSLVLAPNEKYIAYLCELNGLFVTKLENI